MRRRVKDLVDEVFFFQPRPLHTAPAARLGAESIGGNSLYVTGAGEGDDELFVLDQVLYEQLARIMDDTGSPWLRVLLLDRLDLGRDHGTKPGGVRQDSFELLDRRPQLGHFGLELAATKPRKPAEGHVQDMVRLLLAEGERLTHEVGPRIGTILGRARIRAITASSMSMARSSPSTM